MEGVEFFSNQNAVLITVFKNSRNHITNRKKMTHLKKIEILCSRAIGISLSLLTIFTEDDLIFRHDHDKQAGSHYFRLYMKSFTPS
jgi:hypothetical protein